MAVLVWPRRGDEDFVNTVRDICRSQHQLFSGYIYLLLGKAAVGDLQKPMAKVAAQLPTLGSKLEGAAYDSPDVRLMAGAWASHLRNVRALHMAFDRWVSGFEELEGLDLRRYMPDWDNFIAGVETCFQGVDRLLSGQPALYDRKVPELPLDKPAVFAVANPGLSMRMVRVSGLNPGPSTWTGSAPRSGKPPRCGWCSWRSSTWKQFLSWWRPWR